MGVITNALRLSALKRLSLVIEFNGVFNLIFNCISKNLVEF